MSPERSDKGVWIERSELFLFGHCQQDRPQESTATWDFVPVCMQSTAERSPLTVPAALSRIFLSSMTEEPVLLSIVQVSREISVNRRSGSPASAVKIQASCSSHATILIKVNKASGSGCTYSAWVMPCQNGTRCLSEALRISGPASSEEIQGALYRCAPPGADTRTEVKS